MSEAIPDLHELLLLNALLPFHTGILCVRMNPVFHRTTASHRCVLRLLSSFLMAQSKGTRRESNLDTLEIACKARSSNGN